MRLPLSSWRFWVVQAGVLFVAFLDEIVFDFLRFLPPFEIPRSTVTALLLIPVIYAALNFGVHGAVGTALWATALMCPDWLFIAGVTTANAWVEIGNLAILNGVAAERRRGRSRSRLRNARQGGRGGGPGSFAGVTQRLIEQLVGCGTSVGANYCEADDAVSKKEFRLRCGTCKKEEAIHVWHRCASFGVKKEGNCYDQL